MTCAARGWEPSSSAGPRRRRCGGGCRHAYLDTFSFQARGFYERLGYEVFGTLEDFPPGHARYFLRKRDIDRDSSAG